MTGLAMIETSCGICGSDVSEPVLTGVDREHDLAGTFSVTRCARCSHHRLNPRPADSELDKLYPDEYRPFSNQPARRRRRLVGDMRGRLSDVVNFGSWRIATTEGRLLEVGCGSGALLERFSDQGWTAVGIEPSVAASSAARERGLNVLTGIDEMVDDFEAESFDLIHAFMVIEHTPDPVRSLRRLRRVARDDSRLRVSVPNFGHRSRRRFGDCWYALQLPRHYQHFTPESMRSAMEQAGWRIERIWFQPTNADVWGSISIQRDAGVPVHWLGRIQPVSRLLDIVTLPVRALTAQVFGSSRMTVVARPDVSLSTSSHAE